MTRPQPTDAERQPPLPARSSGSAIPAAIAPMIAIRVPSRNGARPPVGASGWGARGAMHRRPLDGVPLGTVFLSGVIVSREQPEGHIERTNTK